ncbi:cytochrome c-type biogenesis protein CcmH [Marinospirillum celere]|uniref:Cytochrome c-type biogenesis protein n=1 Tax=Marinospirillum celere TaxID=1122252 RepID=A0A1I1GZA2_9GAMM|nr:cytochrome c-type biogenesis protein [Marinospirillum celere]SFC16836.1 cytochrome c-type biogenesis protein CcmH [Marinospirillum celere]
MAKRLLIALMLLWIAPLSHAAIELYDFSSEEKRARFHELGAVLRCPMCENQSIIDSESPSAFDMRQELYRLLEEGYTDDEVFEYLKSRFGEFIHYRPPVRQDTWLLWFLPPVLIVGGLLLLVFLARSRSKEDPPGTGESLSERQLKLKKILELDSEQTSTSNSKGSS